MDCALLAPLFIKTIRQDMIHKKMGIMEKRSYYRLIHEYFILFVSKISVFSFCYKLDQRFINLLT